MSIRPCSAIRILLVEDEASLRASLAEMLAEDGHAVCACATPAELPPFVDAHHFDLLLTDYDLPGRSGIDVADEFHAAYPAAAVLLVTACPNAVLAAAIAQRPWVRMARKPFRYEALHGMVHGDGSS